MARVGVDPEVTVRLLLISNSTGPDGGYLDHCAGQIVDFVGASRSVLFVPFAGVDAVAYGRTACDRLERMGLEASWIGLDDDPGVGLADCDAVFVGGGNTFCLVARLYETGLLELLGDAVRRGLAYIGTSAGSNLAGPTIKTTNDMPIVQPASFDAFGFVSFQINPHYVDRDPDSSHQGETREARLREYLEINDQPVLALREGSMLRVEDGRFELQGSAGALVFRRGQAATEHQPGTRWSGPDLP